MNYNTHLELRGKHAIFSASQSGWTEKSPDEILDWYIKSYAQNVGTAIHDICRKHIKRRFKLTKSAKNEVILSLVEDYNIPLFVIDGMANFDILYATAMLYVNDAISFHMVAEQPLYYSDLFFGTADAVTDLNYIFDKKELRIHDLKTGVQPAKMRQLEVYAAENCLEHGLKPEELNIELRIYQGNEILFHKPTPDELYFRMDQIKEFNRIIETIASKEV